MTDSPELTVVVLTYNSAATIGACLDALVNQRCPDFEVIMVDDDSVDETLAVAADYATRLRLTITKNGSHNIPHGRNIGIECAGTDIVAFADSDDCVAPDWTQAIVDTFRAYPDTALVGGDIRPGYRTNVAHAIALNDHAIRRLFGGGVLQFCAANLAINRRVLPAACFDEKFWFAEDLELASRITGPGAKRYVPEMVVYQYSRDTFRQYAKQMYRYGIMKVWFSVASRSVRWLDFIPIALLLAGAGAALALGTWWPLLLNLPFALAEAVFVSCYQRCAPRIAALTFPAWIVKNVAWSVGICRGVVALAVDADTRRLMRGQRIGTG